MSFEEKEVNTFGVLGAEHLTCLYLDELEKGNDDPNLQRHMHRLIMISLLGATKNSEYEKKLYSLWPTVSMAYDDHLNPRLYCFNFSTCTTCTIANLSLTQVLRRSVRHLTRFQDVRNQLESSMSPLVRGMSPTS